MKLIPMTDFVLQIEAEVGKEDYQVVAWQTKIHGYDRINKYANFLKQPLTLGMFVPCDDFGNILEQPIETIGEIEFYAKKYKEAQAKVLFKDIFINSKPIYLKVHKGIRVYNRYEGSTYDKWFSEVFEKDGKPRYKKTIEDLLIYDLDLTVSF